MKIKTRMSSNLAIVNGIFFVFGGCCSNVLSLESLIEDKNSNTGNLVTFCQFLFVTITTLPQFLVFEKGRVNLKPLHVPLKVYLISVLLYYISSTTNNGVFKYNISIPIHIVFRCFSTVITMLTCWLVNNKKYSILQVTSTGFLTFGAIISSMYKDYDFEFSDLKKLLNSSSNFVNLQSMDKSFVFGIFLLIISSVCSSLLSVYNEWTYKTYGKFWQENIFYSHMLAIPIFLLRDGTDLWTEFQMLRRSGNKVKYSIGTLKIGISRKELLLLTNIVTQNICIRGVNTLASYTNALTLSFILTLRKFVSLLLSVIFFSTVLSSTSYFGVSMVFLGTLLYIIGSNKPQQDFKFKS